MTSEDMYNETFYIDYDYSDAINCENGTDYFCNNRSHTQENGYNEVLINSCRYYIEGITLTPISVVGMLGK